MNKKMGVHRRPNLPKHAHIRCAAPHRKYPGSPTESTKKWPWHHVVNDPRSGTRPRTMAMRSIQDGHSYSRVGMEGLWKLTWKFSCPYLPTVVGCFPPTSHSFKGSDYTHFRGKASASVHYLSQLSIFFESSLVPRTKPSQHPPSASANATPPPSFTPYPCQGADGEQGASRPFKQQPPLQKEHPSPFCNGGPRAVQSHPNFSLAAHAGRGPCRHLNNNMCRNVRRRVAPQMLRLSLSTDGPRCCVYMP